ncbi:hypothetical protein GOODEAATRI_009464, partial [Goodea atripinnis]
SVRFWISVGAGSRTRRLILLHTGVSFLTLLGANVPMTPAFTIRGTLPPHIAADGSCHNNRCRRELLP